MRLLVLGGTVFVGRSVVDAALAAGHEVTVFHRGRHGEDAHPHIEHLHGDRERDLGILTGREWDAVVDTCGFTPAALGISAQALADQTGHYAFVSSISVYPGWPAQAPSEDDPTYDDDAPQDYGAQKAAAERAAEAAMQGRVLHARAGLIVGPHENIGRLPFWLRRVARGGEVLAPGAPGETRQWVDARDLAAWLVRMAEREVVGAFNVVSSPGHFTMVQLLEECRVATGGAARFRWVDGAAIAAAGITPWSELPLWLWDATENTSGTWQVPAAKAYAVGFAARPMRDTVADTWAWLQDAGAPEETGYRAEMAVRDLDPAREELALKHARH